MKLVVLAVVAACSLACSKKTEEPARPQLGPSVSASDAKSLEVAAVQPGSAGKVMTPEEMEKA